MISRKVNLKKVEEVQHDLAATRKSLSSMDARDPRFGALLDMYSELLILRAEVERAEMRTRRRP
jgi:hypothetical protein